MIDIQTLITSGVVLAAGGVIGYALKDIPSKGYNWARRKMLYSVTIYQNDELFDVLDVVELKKRQFITFEYLMIKNLNMFEEDVLGLVKNLKSRKAIINLIPFNAFPGSRYQRPSVSEIDEFKNSLVENGLHVMIRMTKGDSILAACGQLTSK